MLGTLIPEEWVTRVGSQLSGMGPIERDTLSHMGNCQLADPQINPGYPHSVQEKGKGGGER